jgi:hypothetical protein
VGVAGGTQSTPVESVESRRGMSSGAVAARAQQPGMPVIGILSASGQPNSGQLGGFLKGLEELGYGEGRNGGLDLSIRREEYGKKSAEPWSKCQNSCLTRLFG